jgi:hypothetical protein
VQNSSIHSRIARIGTKRMSFEPRFYPFKVQRMWKNSQLLPENLGYCDGSHSLGVAIPKWTTTTGREEKRWTERINCSLHVACKLSHGQHDSNSKDHCPTKVSQAFSKAEESVSQLQSSSHIASEVCSKNQSAPGWRTGNGCSHTAGHTFPHSTMLKKSVATTMICCSNL